jgi:hypothetical protein
MILDGLCQHPLARRFPVLWRHDRRCVHFQDGASLRCDSGPSNYATTCLLAYRLLHPLTQLRRRQGLRTADQALVGQKSGLQSELLLKASQSTHWG